MLIWRTHQGNKKMSANSEKNGEESDEVEDKPISTIKQQCINCLKGPNLIKTVVILVCISVVVQQISVCVSKLIDVPITTYTHFDFNKTIQYPSITFCREPPYKFKNMLEYGLFAHPRYTSLWQRFNFSATTLDDLWKNITYEPSEFFVQYGLNGSPDNVEIQETIGFVHGRCYTMNPKILITQANRDSGYSVTLQHNADDIATIISIYPPGYHLYVHYTKEPFTEVQVYNGGLVDYLYVNTGETVDVKLTVDEYVKISSEDDPCTSSQGYNSNQCTAEEVWREVGNAAGCSGPWMSSELPRCADSETMTQLTVAYMNASANHDTKSCPRICRALLYNAYVQERQRLYTWDSSTKLWSALTGDAELQSQLYVHFSSMMVSVFEESYTYDWNIFLADLGGSIGFLLGLSVIGLITIAGKVWRIMVRPFFKSSKDKKSPPSISSSTITIEGLYNEQMRFNKKEESSKKRGEVFKKCNDWQLKSLKEMQLE